MRMLVSPTGIRKGDLITNFKPYAEGRSAKGTKVEEIDFDPRWSCHGVHVNGNACVTANVEVERN